MAARRAAASRAGRCVERLVDARLLEVSGRDPTGQVRYRFHDLVRLFARECLMAEEPADERAATLERLLAGWLTLVTEAHRRAYSDDLPIHAGSSPSWRLAQPAVDALITDPLAWLEAERQAIVAAVRLAADAGLAELCWRLACTAVILFETRSYFDDWRQTHGWALAAARTAGVQRGTAAMLFGLGGLALFQGRLGEARAWYAEALAAYEAAGDDPSQSLILRDLAFVDHRLGRYDLALDGFQRALGRCSPDANAIRASILFGSGHVYLEQGRYEQARRDLDQALSLFREVGDRRGEAYVAYLLGEVRLGVAQLDGAEQAFNVALESLAAVGDRMAETVARHGLARLHATRGRCQEAHRWLDDALHLAQEVGHRSAECRMLLTRGELHAAAGDRRRAVASLDQALDIAAELDQPLLKAMALDALGHVHDGNGDHDAARTVWASAYDLFRHLGSLRADQLATRLFQAQEMGGPPPAERP